MENADFTKTKEFQNLESDSYQRKKMIKEHLLQEAEKLTKK